MLSKLERKGPYYWITPSESSLVGALDSIISQWECGDVSKKRCVLLASFVKCMLSQWKDECAEERETDMLITLSHCRVRFKQTEITSGEIAYLWWRAHASRISWTSGTFLSSLRLASSHSPAPVAPLLLSASPLKDRVRFPLYY